VRGWHPRKGKRRKDVFALLLVLSLLAVASFPVLAPDEGGGGKAAEALFPGADAETDVGSGRLSPSTGDSGGGEQGSASSVGKGSKKETETGSITTQEVDGALPEAASHVLVGYRDDGSCVLVHAGYLDLFGNVWCCVVSGDGWVDTCLVSEKGGTCEVETMRVETEKAVSAYGNQEAAEDR
jgi:hypothetical protein